MWPSNYKAAPTLDNIDDIKSYSSPSLINYLWTRLSRPSVSDALTRANPYTDKSPIDKEHSKHSGVAGVVRVPPGIDVHYWKLRLSRHISISILLST